MNLDDTLYFHNIRGDRYAPWDFWNSIREESGPGGKFYLDIAKRFSLSRFVTRNEGEWSLPWKQEIIPDFAMPAYDPNFNKSFEEVTDSRALEIKALIQQGKKFALLYSGGIDSTLVLVSLLKNLNQEELKSVIISSSMHAVIENPYIWENYIHGKFKILDSLNYWYDDIINMGYMPITSDEGDCIMGTSIGLEMYNNYDEYTRHLSPEVQANLRPLKYKISSGDVHYSAYKDLLIRHFAYNTTPEGLEHGRLLYQKYVHNINTSSVPVHSLHDFFWWLIFNVKYLNCSVRGALYFNTVVSVRQCIDSTINWFNGIDYQLWSMVNNNNGEKIHNTIATYKYTARNYICNYDKNNWYFYFKTKLESLGNLTINGKKTPEGLTNLGMINDYKKISVDDPGVYEYFKHHIVNYKIDWPH